MLATDRLMILLTDIRTNRIEYIQPPLLPGKERKDHVVRKQKTRTQACEFLFRLKQRRRNSGSGWGTGARAPHFLQSVDLAPLLLRGSNSIAGCLQLLEILEILEISWNLKFLLEILEISWIFVDASGKIYNQQCNFCTLRRPVIVSYN